MNAYALIRYLDTQQEPEPELVRQTVEILSSSYEQFTFQEPYFSKDPSFETYPQTNIINGDGDWTPDEGPWSPTVVEEVGYPGDSCSLADWYLLRRVRIISEGE